MAKATARAIASGEMADAFLRVSIPARTLGSLIEPAKSVSTKPGDTSVTLKWGPASWRNASVAVRRAFLVAAYTPIDGVLTGTVEQRTLLGHALEYRIRCGATVLRVHAGRGVGHAQGDVVRLLVPPERCAVVPGPVGAGPG